jgi:enoyl-CoA hydratase/carnithine racemase
MTVEIVRHQGWAEVVLSRPQRKNAITGPLGQALAAAMNELSNDDAMQLVMLRGAGGAFCSGLDIKEFNADPAPEWLPEFQGIWRGAHKALLEFPKPIIGALERFAINGGAALALACDLLVVGDEAFLQVGEVQQGMAAPYNMAWLNLRHSEAVAARVALVGDRLNGPKLVEMGIAVEAVPDEAVLEAASALCERLASYPAGALARIKAGLRADKGSSADAWFDQFTSADPLRAKLSPRAVSRTK